ncbi:hypothetical protein JFQ90_004005 [Aeromonas veronii]|nr:hypothetical protein [Aeromonas veronii]
MTGSKRGEVQKAADRRYEKKRAGMARLPGGYLTQEEADLLDEMAAIYGSKKSAIFKGLELLKNIEEKKPAKT